MGYVFNGSHSRVRSVGSNSNTNSNSNSNSNSNNNSNSNGNGSIISSSSIKLNNNSDINNVNNNSGNNNSIISSNKNNTTPKRQNGTWNFCILIFVLVTIVVTMSSIILSTSDSISSSMWSQFQRSTLLSSSSSSQSSQSSSTTSTATTLFSSLFRKITRPRRGSSSSITSIKTDLSILTTLPLNESKSAYLVCEESPSRPLERLKFNKSRWFTEFLAGPALSKPQSRTAVLSEFDHSTDAAVCLYRHELLYSNHFPHAMQQLYRCVSWWFAHPNLQSVLIFDPSRNKGRGSPFMDGFLQGIQDALNVSIVLNHTSPYVRLKNFQSYVMQNPETDASSLRDRFLTTYGMMDLLDTDWTMIQQSQQQQQQQQQSKTKYDIPRIAILDRLKGEKRNIQNVKRVANQLSRRLKLPYTVPIVYFKNKTFLEQIEFFATTDIVISPHGAQLTGIPFMPNCGMVLELFPKKYFLPSFFGTLANVSNIRHSYLYLSNEDGFMEYSKFTATKDERDTARNAPLCPPIQKIVLSVRQLMNEWNWNPCRSNTINSNTNNKMMKKNQGHTTSTIKRRKQLTSTSSALVTAS